MSACRSACYRDNLRKSCVSDLSARILARISVSVSASWNSSLTLCVCQCPRYKNGLSYHHDWLFYWHLFFSLNRFAFHDDVSGLVKEIDWLIDWLIGGVGLWLHGAGGRSVGSQVGVESSWETRSQLHDRQPTHETRQSPLKFFWTNTQIALGLNVGSGGLGWRLGLALGIWVWQG